MGLIARPERDAVWDSEASAATSGLEQAQSPGMFPQEEQCPLRNLNLHYVMGQHKDKEKGLPADRSIQKGIRLVTETQPRPRPQLTLAQPLTCDCSSPLVAADAAEFRTVSLSPCAMSPEWWSAPAVLHLCGGLLLLLLLLNTPPVRSDCSSPPDMPNATPVLKGATTFPVDKMVYYTCNIGYVKIPRKSHAIQCLSDNTWLQIDPNFCGRSCPPIPRFAFATLKKIHISQNYYPADTVVGYDCATGFESIPSKPAEVTCLANYTWSIPDEFCKKKSCAHPGELKNGYINITEGLLFNSRISFSCNLGYKLIGATSTFCVEIGEKMVWLKPLPTCKGYTCKTLTVLLMTVTLGYLI
ncbi:PREDICTED: complement decay-accelerating factor-like [Elephantulus edwardii]|uniref:complement decay-accelerating factor-like n=1 Tax=Elephantulus edwardii TaxID=28737 RepID=UPI0003F05EE2|nr:PREDICTED: complement decay-accelerating factor-like [Elephantulus edwardii]